LVSNTMVANLDKLFNLIVSYKTKLFMFYVRAFTALATS